MKREHFSRSEKLDLSIEELIQKAHRRKDMANEPTLRMTNDIRRAYQAEVDEDVRSLERVLSRLVNDSAALETQTGVVSPMKQWQERIPIMQQTTEASSTDKSKKPLVKRLDLLVAALCLLVVIGGFLVVLDIRRTNGPASNITTGSYQQATPTALSTLAVPSKQIIYSTNAAAKIITSVGISTSVDHGQVPAMINRFTVGQVIYLVCGANIPKQAGTITVKWYTDNHFYRQDQANVTKGNQLISATFSTVYGLPAEGKAEIYWNDQLAATVLFVVEPPSR